MRKSIHPAVVVIVLGILAILVWVFPLITPPRFITTNLTDDDFVLAVQWRDQSMTLGHVPAHGQLEFRLNYEPPITFTAAFPQGIRLRSKPIDFARGEVVHTQVSRSAIAVAD
jgi:hypothetical protein